MSGAQRRGAMLLRGFAAQNVGIGCAFGGFGVALLPLQQRFGAGAGEVSLGLALVVMAMGLLGPVAASAARRVGLRATMLAGAMLPGLGYVVLAFAPSLLVAQLAFGLLIGPGIALCGPLTVSMLVGAWFPDSPGRAIGAANTPLLVALAPLIGIALIADHGLSVFYLAFAALHLVLLPLLWGIGEAPVMSSPHRPAQPVSPLPLGAVISMPAYWAFLIGAAALSATGIIGVAHMVAVLIERGVAPGQAAGMAALLGGSSALGAFAVGWLCDMFGAARALAIAAACFVAGWASVMLLSGPVAIGIAMILIGACGAGIFPASSVFYARLFGPAQLGRVLGISGVLTLPATFSLPPAAGALRDATGSYGPVAAAIVIGCILVAFLFLAVSVAERGRPAGVAA